ncbi:MAG: hypothetical protein IPO81_19020 [Kouleothrix sp.]|nr:hypothetical protein [Kouleothrix sp.]
MPDPIRFALDEHVAPAVAAGLRRRGVDVTTPQEAELLMEIATILDSAAMVNHIEFL